MKMKITMSVVLLLMTWSLSAQTFATWIIPQDTTTNKTLLLAHNQVMEVLTITLDNSTSLEITINDQTLIYGTGGNKTIPQPLVVSGPATIELRRSTAGDEGSMVTFRVSQIERPARGNAPAFSP